MPIQIKAKELRAARLFTNSEKNREIPNRYKCVYVYLDEARDNYAVIASDKYKLLAVNWTVVSISVDEFTVYPIMDVSLDGLKGSDVDVMLVPWNEGQVKAIITDKSGKMRKEIWDLSDDVLEFKSFHDAIVPNQNFDPSFFSVNGKHMETCIKALRLLSGTDTVTVRTAGIMRATTFFPGKKEGEEPVDVFSLLMPLYHSEDEWETRKAKGDVKV